MNELNFVPLSRTEEILLSIITGEPYMAPALSRVEAQLVALKEAFDTYFDREGGEANG